MAILEGLKFFSPEAETTVGRNRLLHWDQQGRTYSLTFRLADSVPADLLRQHGLDEAGWRKAHPERWTPELELGFHRRFTGAIDRWMDMGFGECLLRRPACGTIVGDALRQFEDVRTRLHAWIVMPNPVYALTEILQADVGPPPAAAFVTHGERSDAYS